MCRASKSEGSAACSCEHNRACHSPAAKEPEDASSSTAQDLFTGPSAAKQPGTGRKQNQDKADAKGKKGKAGKAKLPKGAATSTARSTRVPADESPEVTLQFHIEALSVTKVLSGQKMGRE